MGGVEPEDHARTKRERLLEFQERFDDLGFHREMLGHEIIVEVGEDEKIRLKIRYQTSYDSSQVIRMTFDTQTQMERLFPSLMKGLTHGRGV